jgi:hypothetical protein
MHLSLAWTTRRFNMSEDQHQLHHVTRDRATAFQRKGFAKIVAQQTTILVRSKTYGVAGRGVASQRPIRRALLSQKDRVLIHTPKKRCSFKSFLLFPWRIGLLGRCHSCRDSFGHSLDLPEFQLGKSQQRRAKLVVLPID